MADAAKKRESSRLNPKSPQSPQLARSPLNVSKKAKPGSTSLTKAADSLTKESVSTTDALCEAAGFDNEAAVQDLQAFVRKMATASAMSGRADDGPEQRLLALEQLLNDFYTPQSVLINPFGDIIGRGELFGATPPQGLLGDLVYDVQRLKDTWMAEPFQMQSPLGDWLSTDSVNVFGEGRAGVATYTAMSQIPGAPPVKVTAVYEMTPKGWRNVHEHRTMLLALT